MTLFIEADTPEEVLQDVINLVLKNAERCEQDMSTERYQTGRAVCRAQANALRLLAHELRHITIVPKGKI